MFYNEIGAENNIFAVSLDKKRNIATIFHPYNVTLATSIDESMHMELDINKVAQVDLSGILYKFCADVNDVSEEDVLEILNEGGYLDESN